VNEDLDQFPLNWTNAKLGDVVIIEYGSGLVKKKRATVGRVDVYGSNGVIGHHDKAITKGPTLIIGRKGSVGAVNRSNDPCWPIDTTYYIDEVPEGLEFDYLFYFLKFQPLANLDRSTAIPGINRHDLYDTLMPLPPTNEQRRIIAKVEALFVESRAAREALDKVPVSLRRFRQSVLAKAFRGELTQRDPSDEPAQNLIQKIKQKHPQSKKMKPFKPDELANLPTGWTWARLADIALVERGKFGHRPRNAPRFYGGSYPFIQTGDIARSNGQIATFKQTLNEEGLRISKMFKTGTIVMAIAANIGDTAILKFDACATDSVVGIMPYEPISSEYMEFYLRTRKAELQSFAPATAQKNINLRILDPLPVPIATKEEQERITSKIEQFFSLADNIEVGVKRAKERAEKIDQAVLAKAFRGELVPQDPNDEPASVLLQRIKSPTGQRGSFQTKLPARVL
jgi:type I restriction enzyme S subunit